MGVDIHGKNPSKKLGAYFGANWSGWRSLWGYCLEVSPGIAQKLEDPYYNDGDGLDEEDSKILGENLLNALENWDHSAEGEAKIDLRRYNFYLKFALFLKYCGGFKIW